MLFLYLSLSRIDRLPVFISLMWEPILTKRTHRIPNFETVEFISLMCWAHFYVFVRFIFNCQLFKTNFILFPLLPLTPSLSIDLIELWACNELIEKNMSLMMSNIYCIVNKWNQQNKKRWSPAITKWKNQC